ncbi:MAG: acyltransferase [Deltaproteobacteria bacterium]|nr:acyltransferase [Deltaproteobacteria bacterium]MBN2686561.1 acyltransferase [Deltaproteobacteria bacterium]
MVRYLPGPVRGGLSFILYIVNTVFWTPQLLVVAFLKFIIPIEIWRKYFNIILTRIANNWIAVNNFNHWLFNNICWDVAGVDNLSRHEWYLVLSNHQSWVDILVLQKIFYRRIPFLKFFIKKELIWVPLLGLAWWALDFPFMKRYSSSFIKRNPHLKGKDLETTRKACEKFKTIPVSVMNFVEGTRFTEEKHRKQNSPHKNLLKPKAGGTAFVFQAMGEQIHRIVDVTIAYPGGAKTFWQFLCGKVSDITVRVKSFPVDKDLLGDYFNDLEYRERFQEWLNAMWEEKDRQIEMLLSSRAVPSPGTPL